MLKGATASAVKRSSQHAPCEKNTYFVRSAAPIAAEVRTMRSTGIIRLPNSEWFYSSRQSSPVDTPAEGIVISNDYVDSDEHAR